MELTQEQNAIIHSTGNIKINAVAGSGKTTTIIEYAKSRSRDSKILYLAFNKSVKSEAIKKFADHGLTNVKVETAHSLAYKHIVFAHNYTVRPQGYRTNEIAELLNLTGKGEKHAKYVVAKLSNPRLNFDYILFDEGQDASMAMLDVFLKQKAVKVIVGDTFQQIYGWRFAVNSLEKADFKTFHLSTSFRFSQDIANLAMEILKLKEHLGFHRSIPITGKGSSKEIKSKAVLARTNLGLLLKAIEYVTENKKVKPIYFEGNINSYTYADDGTSLYDVLSLYNGNRQRIKDKLISVMKDLEELEDYIDKTEDVQLGMMVEIVKEYGNKIPGIIKTIKERHIENDDKEKAEMIFSTVHRCKGMEYDTVQLVNDFITEDKLEKIQESTRKEERNAFRLNEEINLLYVAVTRARNRIHIPEALMPAGFPPSSQIHIIKTVKEEEKKPAVPPRGRVMISDLKPGSKSTVKEKAWSIGKIRSKHKEAYRPWTTEMDDELTVMYCEGINLRDMAKQLGRSRGAIMARIVKLDLEELYG
jgi:F-box protein, helicase, 18